MPLRHRWRWVSPAMERKIEAARGPQGSTWNLVCHKDCRFLRSLRLHVNAHFLLVFCPCGYHGVYPYPVTTHMASGCHSGVHHTVDANTYPEFLAVICPLVKKALVLAVLTQGFQTVLKYARQHSPMVSDKPEAVSVPDEPIHNEIEEEAESPPRALTPQPERPTRSATIEERLLRLQEDFTQLAPSLLTTTTGLCQLKDSVGGIKRRLRTRQAKYRSQAEQT